MWSEGKEGTLLAKSRSTVRHGGGELNLSMEEDVVERFGSCEVVCETKFIGIVSRYEPKILWVGIVKG